METTTIAFDQLPHVVSGLSEKLNRVLELLEKVGAANPFQTTQALPENRSRERGLHDYRQVTLDLLPRNKGSECPHSELQARQAPLLL